MVDLVRFGGKRKCDLNKLDKIIKELKDINCLSWKMMKYP